MKSGAEWDRYSIIFSDVPVDGRMERQGRGGGNAYDP